MSLKGKAAGPDQKPGTAPRRTPQPEPEPPTESGIDPDAGTIVLFVPGWAKKPGVAKGVAPVKADLDDQYTTAQAARVLKLKPAAIRAWIRSGRLKARKQGGRYLVRAADLAACASLRPGAEPEPDLP